MRAFLIIVFMIPLIISAQTIIDVSKESTPISGTTLMMIAQGYPLSPSKYIRVVEGSPYYRDEWMKGKLVTSQGQLYDSLRLRLDLVDHELQYISSKGEELIATTAIRGVTLVDSLTAKQIHFIHSSFIPVTSDIEKGWYQILVSGPATLYKRTGKTISENKPYGSATVEQTIRASVQYFILSNGTLTRIKKFKEIPDVLGNKRQELVSYSKSLNGKSDADYYNLVFYYNRLLEK